MSNYLKTIISAFAIMCVLTSCGDTSSSNSDLTAESVSVEQSSTTTTTKASVVKLDDSSSNADTTTVTAMTTTVVSTQDESKADNKTTTVVTTTTAEETTLHTKVTEAPIIDNATGFVTITFGKIKYSFPTAKFSVPESWEDDGTDEENPVFTSKKVDGVYIKQYVKDNITYGMSIDVLGAMVKGNKLPGIKIHDSIGFGSKYSDIKKSYGEAQVSSAKLKTNKEYYTIYEYNLVDETKAYKLRFSVFEKSGLFAIDITVSDRPDPVVTTTSATTKSNTKKDTKSGTTTKSTKSK